MLPNIKYKDLDIRFDTHPSYSDIKPLQDISAIKNSIKNILMTTRGEKPFTPLFGCNIEDFLFEPVDDITSALMEEEILFSIEQHEPRVKVNHIEITDDPQRNSYNITLEVTIINSQENAELKLILERIR